MSSDIRLQNLDTCEDNNQIYSGPESSLTEKFLPKSDNLLQESHDTLNYARSNNECANTHLDADFDKELEISKTSETSHFGKDERVENSYKCLIKDQEHFEKLQHTKISRERSEGLKLFTDTFPQDPIVQRAWVKRIFDAILDLDGIIDKKTKYHNSSSQAARRIRDGYYPDLEIEKTAWRLMVNIQNFFPVLELSLKKYS